MIRNYINHTLQTNLLLREEEAYNTYGHKAPKDIFPKTRKDTTVCITWSHHMG